MYFSFIDPLFWIYGAIFFLSISFVWLVPGFLIIRKFKIISPLTQFVLSIILGIVLWGSQGYVFGYLNLRILTYVYLVVLLVFFVRHLSNFITFANELVRDLRKIPVVILITIVVGSVCQLLPIFGSGMRYEEGVKFFGNNGYDGVMHLANIQSIVINFPPQEMGFSGSLIYNYHYWTDLVLAELVRIFHLPITHLFFQYTPLFLSVFTGFVAYRLVKEIKGSSFMAFWFLFLLYFGSGAGYIVLLVLQKPLEFSVPAIDSGVLQFLNMPHVFGKMIFLGSLITLYKWTRETQLRWGIMSVFLMSALFGFKVYFGIFAAIGIFSVLFASIIRDSIKNKKLTLNIKSMFLFLIFIFISAVIYLPNNSGAGGLVFAYLVWPRSLLGPGSIDWSEWWLRRQVYVAYGNIRNIILLDIISVVITFVSIHGTRLLGFSITKNMLRFFGWELSFFLIPGLIVFHFLGLFTIQSSGGANIFNFFSVSVVVLSLMSAFVLSSIKSKKILLIVGFVFIILTAPRSIYEIYNSIASYGSTDVRVVSNDALVAFNFIQRNTPKDSVIQAHWSNSWDRQAPYIPFFSNRYSYLSGWKLLSTHNVPISERRQNFEDVFKLQNSADFSSQLRKMGISYIYLQKNVEERLKFIRDETELPIVFENSSVSVIKVQ